jgi:tetratricopeptide (TPR) repeat protein
VELNHKQEWTLVLRKDADNWYVRQNLNGNPSLYFKQNELYQNIATLLGNSDDQKAYFEISEAMRSYVDSADLFYYRALYWLLVKAIDKAKVDLFNAIALDNLFTPPYMHLGLLYLNEKNYSEARLWFSAVLDLEPDNPDAANNLAIALLAGGDKADALKVWRELLKKNPAYELAKKNLDLYG